MTSDNDLAAEDALNFLLQRIELRTPDLANHIRLVINAGHDVVESEPRQRRGRGKPRTFRRTVQFTFQEALEVVIDALGAYFVELPLMIDSVINELQETAMLEVGATSTDSRGYDFHLPPRSGVGERKALEIELQVETQITPVPARENVSLSRAGPLAVGEQRTNLMELAELLNVVIPWQPLQT
jgi:hypothetical protein